MAPSFPSSIGCSAIAWRNFGAGARPDLRSAFEAFCHEQRHWLDDYALFRALKAGSRGLPTSTGRRNWCAASRRRWTRPGGSSRRPCEEIRFAQFLLFRQGGRLKEYARSRGRASSRRPAVLCLAGFERRVGGHRNSSGWTNTGGRGSSRACRLITSAPRVSSGAIPSTTGTALRRDRLPLVDRAAARPARPCRHGSPRSLPRFRRRMARPCRIGNGGNRQLGPRPWRRFLRRGTSRIGRAAVHCRGFGPDHARRHRIARPVRVPGDAGAPVRL